MCPLLAQLKIGFFFSVVVYSANEANKAGLEQSIFLDVYACNSHYCTCLGHLGQHDTDRIVSIGQGK